MLSLLLSVYRASATYDEVVKAMMQEAMNQANLDPEAREMLDKLRGAFNDDMGGGTGDMNQDVMRMMYALQQMMTEQGISDEDAVEMRKMMQEMGIDTKELIQNAEVSIGGKRKSSCLERFHRTSCSFPLSCPTLTVYSIFSR